MSRKTQHRKDANHDLVRDGLEARGFLFISTSNTNLGFDALVAKDGRLTAIEIKPGEAKDKRRLQLTPHEQVVHAALLAKGVRVEVITGEQDFEVLGREQRARREG